MKTLLILMAVPLLLGACGDDGDAPAAGARPASTAELTILQPKLGATVEGPDVEVVVQIENATLLEEASRDLRPDTGHVHVSVNDQVATLLAGERYTIEGLDPGRYVIKVEFAAADHGSFSPPVVETVTITVT